MLDCYLQPIYFFRNLKPVNPYFQLFYVEVLSLMAKQCGGVLTFMLKSIEKSTLVTVNNTDGSRF